jgi:predicted nucleotidyltransferase
MEQENLRIAAMENDLIVIRSYLADIRANLVSCITQNLFELGKKVVKYTLNLNLNPEDRAVLIDTIDTFAQEQINMAYERGYDLGYSMGYEVGYDRK